MSKIKAEKGELGFGTMAKIGVITTTTPLANDNLLVLQLEAFEHVSLFHM